MQSACFYHFSFRFESISKMEGMRLILHSEFQWQFWHFSRFLIYLLWMSQLGKNWHCDVACHVNMFWHLNSAELERSGCVVKLPFLLILAIFTSTLGHFAKVSLRTGGQERPTPIHTSPPPTHTHSNILKQVTSHNIVADGWAVVANPHPHPTPHPNPLPTQTHTQKCF